MKNRTLIWDVYHGKWPESLSWQTELGLGCLSCENGLSLYHGKQNLDWDVCHGNGPESLAWQMGLLLESYVHFTYKYIEKGVAHSHKRWIRLMLGEKFILL